MRVFPVQPNSLGIRGAGNGLQFALVGNDRKALERRGAARSSPRWRRTRASSSRACRSTPTQPQLSVAIDRERASDLGIDINGLADAMQAMLDGNEIGDVFIDDRSYA